ncbi:N-acetylated-alpha-linked acidic dipeptidase [Tothia fuscella]|uniref:N-acetylated-alpha-linked acidic dipeptidase n=1 Tax=Tothia fuscella TaxID=1048955 RepID=A0A9P4NWB0_9PEZI|nr:N-acetylated-alpha-linked acidic dipeptidase [Tothia fuscella]
MSEKSAMMSKDTPPLLSPPIPTYEEATSSTPTHERENLLGTNLSRRNGYYQPPSVQSVRSSEDSTAIYPRNSSEDSDADLDDEGLRREVEQMGMVDLDELEEGRRRRGKGWVGKILGFKRRMGRWKKWRWRPGFTDGWAGSGHTYSRINLPSLPSMPERYTPGCSVIARLLGLFIVIALGYALFVFELMPNARNAMGQMFDPEGIRVYAQAQVNRSRIEEHLRHIASFNHVAGTEGSRYLGKWIEGLFYKSSMEEVRMDKYYAYLNYPQAGGRRVAIVDPPEMSWHARLEEDPVYPDGGSARANTAAFHGHSRTGDVTGPLIYVNYGSKADYKRFYDSGININGTIALVRYYGSQSDRALKVKAAEEWGVKGVLIYSDPADDGFVQGKVWPAGPWRPSDSVQRGTVSMMSWVVGDVLTPGWASTKDAKRISKDNNPGLVNIPSLPLAWRDAQKLLQSLKGHGTQLPEEWIGGVPDIEEWWSGDLKSPLVNLKNEQEEQEKQPIYNVMGSFVGVEIGAKKIVVGNHRDSWCFGAADPGSGTAIMLEVIEVLGKLREQGWRPLRTIEFASWDAEEYNMIGSTEYVEDHIDTLRRDGIAYLNVDVGVVGPNFWAAASPLYKTALLRVLDRVSDPIRNETLRALFQRRGTGLEGLGSGSDYVAFQDMAGMSSIDFGFEGEKEHSFPYHSCYETFEWMSQYGDPGFVYHKLLAEVWVLLILELSQELILPFDLNDYAEAMGGYITSLHDYAEKKGAPWADENGKGGFDVAPLYAAQQTFTEKAKYFHEWQNWWYSQVYGRGGLETNTLSIQRRARNNILSHFETELLDLTPAEQDPPEEERHGVSGFFTALIKGGLRAKNGTTADEEEGEGQGERGQFKHVVFGPQKWSGYDVGFFPKIRDEIEVGNWTEAQRLVDRVAGIVKNACERLQ